MVDHGEAIDLLEHIHLALGDFDEPLGGRSITIEMLRLRADIDPTLFRRALGALIAQFLERSGSSDGLTVSVTRSDKALRIEVLNDEDDSGAREPPDLTSLSDALHAAGAAVGIGPAGSPVIGWITVPAEAGTGGPADA